jgi:hypothetical protein
MVRNRPGLILGRQRGRHVEGGSGFGAVETIDGDFASIVVLHEDTLTSPAATDSIAADVDVAHHRQF